MCHTRVQKVKNIDECTTNLTFGTNTKHSVAVVQKIMKTEINMNTASRRSASTMAIDAPIMHIINTLYTLKPMCLESLSAGMDTWRVSHAKNAPKIWRQRNKRMKGICLLISEMELLLPEVILCRRRWRWWKRWFYPIGSTRSPERSEHHQAMGDTVRRREISRERIMENNIRVDLPLVRFVLYRDKTDRQIATST